MDTFNVTCNLCDRKADLRKMRKYKGQYYHNIKIADFKTTCLEAAKNNDRRR